MHLTKVQTKILNSVPDMVRTGTNVISGTKSNSQTPNRSHHHICQSANYVTSKSTNTTQDLLIQTPLQKLKLLLATLKITDVTLNLLMSPTIINMLDI